MKGKERVLRNLRSAQKQIEQGTAKGFIYVSMHLRQDMENTPPRIPVDTGHLRASYFTTVSDGKTEIFTEGKAPTEARADILGVSAGGMALGFTADHAWRVHEDMEANFKRPGSGPKFLEKALERNKSRILKILSDNAKL